MARASGVAYHLSFNRRHGASAMSDLSIAAKLVPYKPKHKVRFVTATSLFDGHDASINIMRRILQATGVEVIHLGHNRSVEEIVNAALQEDAQGIAVSSYSRSAAARTSRSSAVAVASSCRWK
jgi:methylmalonyl-CoA mutase cobalamin-binding subunit